MARLAARWRHDRSKGAQVLRHIRLVPGGHRERQGETSKKAGFGHIWLDFRHVSGRIGGGDTNKGVYVQELGSGGFWSARRLARQSGQINVVDRIVIHIPKG